jgi:predicted O-linked N-acetylglucosamine transferase (SPINDLY family)
LQAIRDYERALEINPRFEYLLGTLQHLKMLICDWKNFEENILYICQVILLGEKASDPFSLLSLIDSPKLQFNCSKIFANDKYQLDSDLGVIKKNVINTRIKVGYFSADFHNHATAYLMADFFESHDKDKFELIAFSFGPNFQDDMRQRLTNAFDQFIDVRNLTDIEIAKLSRQFNIDIAVDLKGYTNYSRPKIFSYRAAPIQINYLGYPGTMANDCLDYIIADQLLIEDNDRKFYSEKIVRVPGTYQVNDRKRNISERQFTKSELGLPEKGFVFCCFNNNYKITPTIFKAWIEILNSVPNSVLWLLEDNEIAKANIKKESLLRGLEENRIIFAKRMQLPEHLARHQHADLFLDAFPYNGHTTTSDALWAGLPVLTLKGESFVSRVAASLLSAIDLPELITTTIEDYQHQAIQLALNPDRLKEIKIKLKINRETTALFDTLGFTKNLEKVYRKMIERQNSDLLPDHIDL